MSPLFLTKSGIGEVLGMSPEMARAVLAERGVNPVDFGRGRGRGLRWFAEAVATVAADMHREAQEEVKTARTKRRPRPAHLSNFCIMGRTNAEIMASLTDAATT